MRELLQNLFFPKQVRLEKAILALAEELKESLLPRDVENIRVDIEHNEFGVAFETLCQQLFEHEHPISTGVYDRIEKLGIEMGYSDDTWNFLRSLIKTEDPSGS